MDENISRAAGAEHGQELDDAEFRAIVEPLGRPLEQRTTLYGRVDDRRPAAAAAAKTHDARPRHSRQRSGARRVAGRGDPASTSSASATPSSTS